MFSILVVCTGNVCRSAAAELLLRAGLPAGLVVRCFLRSCRCQHGRVHTAQLLPRGLALAVSPQSAGHLGKVRVAQSQGRVGGQARLEGGAGRPGQFALCVGFE